MIGFLRHVWQKILEKIRHYFLKRSARQVSLHHLDVLPLQRILVLCYGNIYRSALVGRYLTDQLTGSAIEVRSAGFYPKADRSSPESYVSLLQEYQVDLSAHRSQRVCKEDSDWADTILIMDCHNQDALVKLDKKALDKVVWLGALTSDANIEIIDPYGREEPLVRQIIQRLLDASGQLLQRIKSN